MKRSEIRAFIEKGVEAMSPQIPFGSGRISEFNSSRKNEYKYIWLESLSVTVDLLDTGLPYDNWQVILHIAKKDAPGSSPKEYECIIDDCDYVAQQLIKQYNGILTGYNLLTLDGITRFPFIHKLADDTSGVILSFNLHSPDITPIC